MNNMNSEQILNLTNKIWVDKLCFSWCVLRSTNDHNIIPDITNQPLYSECNTNNFYIYDKNNIIIADVQIPLVIGSFCIKSLFTNISDIRLLNYCNEYKNILIRLKDVDNYVKKDNEIICHHYPKVNMNIYASDDGRYYSNASIYDCKHLILKDNNNDFWYTRINFIKDIDKWDNYKKATLLGKTLFGHACLIKLKSTSNNDWDVKISNLSIY